MSNKDEFFVLEEGKVFDNYFFTATVARKTHVRSLDDRVGVFVKYKEHGNNSSGFYVYSLERLVFGHLNQTTFRNYRPEPGNYDY